MSGLIRYIRIGRVLIQPEIDVFDRKDCHVGFRVAFMWDVAVIDAVAAEILCTN